MAVYSLSPIFKPQYVANAAALLTFATPGAPTVVPSLYNYQVAVARVSNKTAAPVTFKMWRVPSGATNDDEHIIVPTINIPVATQTFPWFDLTAIWGITLAVGDGLYALAGAASSLTIHADGAVIEL